MNTSYSISPEQRAKIAASVRTARQRVIQAYEPFILAARDRQSAKDPFEGTRDSPIFRRAILRQLRRNSPRRNTESLTSPGFSLRSDGLTPFPESVVDFRMFEINFAKASLPRTLSVLGLQTEDPAAMSAPCPEGHVLVRMPPGYYLDPEGLYIGDIMVGDVRPEYGLCFCLDEKGLWHIELARENLAAWLAHPTYIQGPTDGCDV